MMCGLLSLPEALQCEDISAQQISQAVRCDNGIADDVGSLFFVAARRTRYRRCQYYKARFRTERRPGRYKVRTEIRF
jgi:hypothetical protein